MSSAFEQHMQLKCLLIVFKQEDNTHAVEQLLLSCSCSFKMKYYLSVKNCFVICTASYLILNIESIHMRKYPTMLENEVKSEVLKIYKHNATLLIQAPRSIIILNISFSTYRGQ